MTLLTVVTRHLLSREEQFAVCAASLRVQTDQDFQHLVLEDSKGHGIEWANRQLIVHKDKVYGDYVFILDDDDQLISENFVAEIRDIVIANDPDLIVMQMDHKGRILPKQGMRCPGFGEIGISAVVVQRDVWMQAIEAFEPKRGGDYPFLTRCYELADKIMWIKKAMSKMQ